MITSTRDNTFMGVGIRQSVADVVVWELFFRLYNSYVRHLVELGTGNGGFSLFLLMQCFQHGVAFDTYDLKKPIKVSKLARNLKLLKHCHAQDLLTPGAPKQVLLQISRPLVLFCDNGNKPLEVERFGPHLVEGDYLVVHDWDVEIFPKDIPARFIPIAEINGLCEQFGSVTRFFRVLG